MCGSSSGAPPTMGSSPPRPPPRPPSGNPVACVGGCGGLSLLPSPVTSTVGAISRSPVGPASCCCGSSCRTRIVGSLTGSSDLSISAWVVRVTCKEGRTARDLPASRPPSRLSRSLGRPQRGGGGAGLRVSLGRGRPCRVGNGDALAGDEEPRGSLREDCVVVRLTGSEGSGEAKGGEDGRVGESGEPTCTSFSG